MQQPLPPVSPTIPAAPPPAAAAPAAPAQSQKLQDLSAPYRGWYPRWWLLSAIICSLLVGLVYLLHPFICDGRLSGSPLCQFPTWTDWREDIVMGIVWGLFLLTWFFSMILGIAPIELTQAAQRSFVAQCLRAVSEFRSIYILLLIYAGLAFSAIFFMWALSIFQPMAFTLCSILIFVANSAFLYRRTPQERKTYLLGYGVLAAFGIALMFITGIFQPAILATEAIVILVGALALFSHPAQPQPTSPPTPEEILAMANARAISTGEIFRATIRSMLHRNRNPGNPTVP